MKQRNECISPLLHYRSRPLSGLDSWRFAQALPDPVSCCRRLCEFSSFAAICFRLRPAAQHELSPSLSPPFSLFCSSTRNDYAGSWLGAADRRTGGPRRRHASLSSMVAARAALVQPDCGSKTPTRIEIEMASAAAVLAASPRYHDLSTPSSRCWTESMRSTQLLSPPLSLSRARALVVLWSSRPPHRPRP